MRQRHGWDLGTRKQAERAGHPGLKQEMQKGDSILKQSGERLGPGIQVLETLPCSIGRQGERA